jgi:hypothetical protein
MISIGSPNCVRFILLIKFAHTACANVEIFDSECAARERWPAAAISSVPGLLFGWQVVSWARLFSGPPVGFFPLIAASDARPR